MYSSDTYTIDSNLHVLYGSTNVKKIKYCRFCTESQKWKKSSTVDSSSVPTYSSVVSSTQVQAL